MLKAIPWNYRNNISHFIVICYYINVLSYSKTYARCMHFNTLSELIFFERDISLLRMELQSTTILKWKRKQTRMKGKELTVWVQSHGQLVWREYFARDRRGAASRLTVDVITEVNERRDDFVHPLTVELLLLIWLMTKSWWFVLRGRPRSYSMMDSLTLSTIHPFGHRYSRLYLHPLHLLLLGEKEKKKEKEKFTWNICFGINTQD